MAQRKARQEAEAERLAGSGRYPAGPGRAWVPQKNQRVRLLQRGRSEWTDAEREVVVTSVNMVHQYFSAQGVGYSEMNRPHKPFSVSQCSFSEIEALLDLSVKRHRGIGDTFGASPKKRQKKAAPTPRAAASAASSPSPPARAAAASAPMAPTAALADQLAALEDRLGLPNGKGRPPNHRLDDLEVFAELDKESLGITGRIQALKSWAERNGF
jgi:hypothetical protein